MRRIEEDLQENTDFSEEYEEKAGNLLDTLCTEDVEGLEDILCEELSKLGGVPQLDLTFQKPDLLESLKNLKIKIRESSQYPSTDAEKLGQGLQSLLIISIVRAYQKLYQQSPILIIEEPEIHLHPQARRAFYRTLLKTANEAECQIFYSTHSTEFVDPSAPQQIVMVRKDPMMGTITTQGNSEILYDNEREELKVICEVDSAKKEFLFADVAILCEGPTEAKSIPILIKKVGINLGLEGWTTISVGGKENLPFFLKLANHFRVPCVVVADTDSDKGNYEAHHKELNSSIINLAGGEDQTWFSDPNFEVKYNIPHSESKARTAVKWAEGLSEEDAEEIITPLLRKIEDAQS